MATLAFVALLLAALGIYSVIAYAVGQQTPEIGLRVALGAQPAAVRMLVLGQALRPVGLGLGFGLLISLAATRLLSSLLYQVAATDPLTLVSVPVLLICVAAIAAYIPARRVTQVDPVIALRQ